MNKLALITQIEVEKIVKESTSLREVQTKLNTKTTGPYFNG